MNNNQIIRIPYKYWELINTMDDQECWKLMKALFFKDSSKLEWLSETYYNIIIVDINNLENQVKKGQEWGKKWGRPKNNKTHRDIEKKTPPIWEKKPKISKDKIIEDKVSKDIIEWEIIETELINIESNIFKTISNEKVLEKYKITEEELEIEIELFTNYWKAPVINWKENEIWEELWSIQKTFEPNLRLWTWLRNNNKYNKKDLKPKILREIW